MYSKEIPSPGSDQALRIGCTCSVLDNGHGKGSVYGKNTFWYDVYCPVHREEADSFV
jgi:hypothetical protein